MVADIGSPDVADGIENFVFPVFNHRHHVFDRTRHQIVVNVGKLFDILVKMQGKQHELRRRQFSDGLRHDFQPFYFVNVVFQIPFAENRRFYLSQIGHQHAVIDRIKLVDNFPFAEFDMLLVMLVVKNGNGNVVRTGIVQNLGKSFRNFVGQNPFPVKRHLFPDIIIEDAAQKIFVIVIVAERFRNAGEFFADPAYPVQFQRTFVRELIQQFGLRNFKFFAYAQNFGNIFDFIETLSADGLVRKALFQPFVDIAR